jgi:NADPH-dependent 2,4-dienoyl-CoA reductase/sulfur reductase-like enzyme
MYLVEPLPLLTGDNACTEQCPALERDVRDDPGERRNDMSESADVVVVGGGIAGSALATVMARDGYQVVVLERQRGPRAPLQTGDPTSTAQCRGSTDRPVFNLL